MDRKAQLRNVSFGGAWSEQIAGTEDLTASLRLLEAAAERTKATDLRRCPETHEALRHVADAHPKGHLLMVSWGRALNIPDGNIRAGELARIGRTLRAGLGDRIAD